MYIKIFITLCYFVVKLNLFSFYFASIIIFYLKSYNSCYFHNLIYYFIFTFCSQFFLLFLIRCFFPLAMFILLMSASISFLHLSFGFPLLFLLPILFFLYSVLSHPHYMPYHCSICAFLTPGMFVP